jgi:hypothetical protein
MHCTASARNMHTCKKYKTRAAPRFLAFDEAGLVLYTLNRCPALSGPTGDRLDHRLARLAFG